MTLSEGRFVAIAGGVSGRDHRRALRDGQDGSALVSTPDITAVVVTDGCSSGRESEVGARLGAAWIVELASRSFRAGSEPADAASDVVRRLVRRLRVVARSLSARGEVDPRVVGDMLLFGFLAAVVTPAHAIVFGVGDGLVWVDGRTTRIDPGPENAPTYPAYALLGATIAPHILHLGAADELDTIAIATDGADELLAPEANPTLEALVTDERLLANPSLLRKRLLVLSDRGRFQDDATIGIVRRAS